MLIPVLTPEEVKFCLDNWSSDMVDGTESQPLSTYYNIKKNTQSGSLSKEVRHLVTDKLYKNTFIDSVICPKDIHVNFFNEYKVGDHYKKHVDAFKANPKSTNTFFDYGFSICLDDDFDGGEFIMETEHTELAFKPQPGQAVMFPVIYPHGVLPVTRGSRKSLIGWLSTNVSYEQSYILRKLYDINSHFIKEQDESNILKATLVQTYLKKHWGMA
jgi:PKHD-type hydroxylase